MRWAVFIAATLCILACSPEKRLGKLLLKHPELNRVDTIHDTVTAIVEYVHTDTVFVAVPGDTVRIDKGRLHVKYVNMPGDTVWIEGECDADTIRVPVETIVERVAPITFVDRIPWWWWLIVAALVIAVVGLIWKR